MMRKLDDKQLVVQASDSRIINIKRDKKTKFLNNGEDMKPRDIKPGDHLRVSASEDEQGYFYAIEVNFDKAGTPEERAAASEPIQRIQTGDDDAPPAARSSGISANESSGASDDPDRPILRRKDPPPTETAKATPPEASASAPPAAPVPNPPVAAPAAAQAPARTEPAADPDAVPSVGSILKEPPPPAAPRDPDDPGPPKLKHGKPPSRPSTDHAPVDDSPSQPVQTASARPPAGPAPIAHPSEPIETPTLRQSPPEAPQQRQDPVIEKTREQAGAFTETLPDYICQEFMARYFNSSHTVNWQPQDVVSTEVIYEKGRERYRNVTVNGKPKKSIEESGGAWSTGEFASVLLDLFSPATAANFRYRRESTIAGKIGMVYDFDVIQPNSHWSVMAGAQSYRPAYRGSVWIDKRTYRALRIEMQAYHFPPDFPLDKVESATDYDFVRFGGTQQFLMPVHAETLSCQTGTNQCAMNKIDFRNYHKYSGESTITFGADQPDTAQPQNDKKPPKK